MKEGVIVREGVLFRYKDFLPITESTPMITLNEGNTPLIRARHVEIGDGVELYFKYEGLNPTGSFKDRGMVMAVAKAVEDGSKAIMCASTGNTSASAAAYAARVGIKALVVIPQNAIALGKLAQALIYGAKVIAIRGNFDDALAIVREITSIYPITLVNSVNPYRLEGQKTAAFEVVDALGDAPDYLGIPVGNAGNISAYWNGFKEYNRVGRSSKLPQMLGFQASGAAPIVRGKVVEKPETIATAIRIGNPVNWSKAVSAAEESGGMIDMVSDDEILDAYKMLASKEGIFAEPASAASVAGVLKLARKGFFKRDSKVVCVLTGHGLKDPNIAISSVNEPIVVDAHVQRVMDAIGIGG